MTKRTDIQKAMSAVRKIHNSQKSHPWTPIESYLSGSGVHQMRIACFCGAFAWIEAEEIYE